MTHGCHSLPSAIWGVFGDITTRPLLSTLNTVNRVLPCVSGLDAGIPYRNTNPDVYLTPIYRYIGGKGKSHSKAATLTQNVVKNAPNTSNLA